MLFRSILGLFLSLNEKFPISNIFLFQALFVFTFAVGIWEICQYRRFKFEAKPVLETESFGKKLLGVIKTLPEHPDYVRYCLTAIVFYLGWQMAWPLYNMYQLNVLNASAAWVGYLQIA